MSYCRWSSDNWKSDIYCYESVHGGYDIHVAASRIVGDVPEVDWSTPEKFVETHRAAGDFIDKAERAPIGLPYDGESFNENTAEECRDRLLALRSVGYHVPNHALAALEEEIAEDASTPPGVQS